MLKYFIILTVAVYSSKLTNILIYIFKFGIKCIYYWLVHSYMAREYYEYKGQNGAGMQENILI